MAESFGIPEIIQYLTQMGLKTSQVDPEQELVELAFHGEQRQWRMIVGLQQSGEVRKLMFIIPQVATLTARKRLECLEALLAVNYRISLGKFGLDLEDGEVRLEEIVPLANDSLTFEQFQLVLSAMVQTYSIYHELLPRILDQNFSVVEAMGLCEQEFYQELDEDEELPALPSLPETPSPQAIEEEEAIPTFDLNEILAEVSHILEEGRK